MSRGILYIFWDNRPPKIPKPVTEPWLELVSSARYARKEGLPVAVGLDEGFEAPYVDLDLFDQVVRHPFARRKGEKSAGLFRKSFMCDISPFDETLYLDSDCWINDGSFPVNPDYPPQKIEPPLDFGFELAARHGIALAHDSHVMGLHEYRDNPESGERGVTRVYPVFMDKLAELLGRHTYLPCFNSGVVFFNQKNPRVRAVFEQAQDYAVNHACNDQVALTLAMEKLRFTPGVLPDRVWNCRMTPGEKLPWPGVKMAHNPRWRGILKKMTAGTEENLKPL